MSIGYAGKILVLDLTNKSTSIMDTEPYEEYGGGYGLASAVFWDLRADKLPFDSFDPKNITVIAASPFTGTLVPAAARCDVSGVAAQGYPTSWFTHGNFGGRFAGELKHAGWDAIAVTGVSAEPVWVNIINDKVTLESAEDLWGKGTWETQEAIWDKLDSKEVKGWNQYGTTRTAGRSTQRSAILCIGPMGEVMARDFGCLVHDGGKAVGQGGFGAVWGSKKLKAISIIGTLPVEVADPKALMEANLWAMKYHVAPEEPEIDGAHNHNKEPIGQHGNVFVERTSVGPDGCQLCPICCGRRAPVGGTNGSTCCAARYYRAAAFAANAGIEDMGIANDIQQQYGANTYAMDYLIKYFVSLHSLGIMGPGKAIDSSLPFDKYGLSIFIKEILDMIVEGTGIGLDLREGILNAVKKWGRLDEDLKSGILMFPYWGYPEHGYDTRAQLEFGFGSIFDSRCHNEHEIAYVTGWYTYNHIGKEYPLSAEKLVTSAVRAMVPYQDDPHMLDFSDANMYSEHIAKLLLWQRCYGRFWKQSMGLCDWGWADLINMYTPDLKGLTPEAEPKFYTAVTGKPFSFEDGIKVGQKIWNLHNAIWTLQGRHRDMVKFPDYIYDSGTNGFYEFFGPGFYVLPVYENNKWDFKSVYGRNIDRDKFEDFKTIFYKLNGWDTTTGWPTRAILESLGLKKVADKLESVGKLGS